jgi:uncharacterized tellurite resistance protein B-like protein
MDFLKRMFGSEESESGRASAPDLRVAATALFIEIASSDNEFSEDERVHILEIIQREYKLSKDDAEAIAREASALLDESIDLWRFTNAINEHYSDDEKMRVVELLWSVVFVDGRLDGHEDYLIHRVAKLLRLQHKQLIAAKIRIMGKNEG